MAVVLASGGIDSTVLLYELAAEGQLTAAVIGNYGQPNFPKQVGLVNYHADELLKRYGKRVVVEVVPLWAPEWTRTGRVWEGASGPVLDYSCLDDVFAPEISPAETREMTKDSFCSFPLRNAFLCFYAAIFAAKYDIEAGFMPEIFLGIQFDERTWAVMERIVDDTTFRFFNWVSLALNEGMNENAPALVLPFVERRWDKQMVVERGRVLDIDLEKTYSCEFGEPCGRCIQCFIRKEGLGEACMPSA